MVLRLEYVHLPLLRCHHALFELRAVQLSPLTPHFISYCTFLVKSCQAMTCTLNVPSNCSTATAFIMKQHCHHMNPKFIHIWLFFRPMSFSVSCSYFTLSVELKNRMPPVNVLHGLYFTFNFALVQLQWEYEFSHNYNFH